jgi:hypothetical protein
MIVRQDTIYSLPYMRIHARLFQKITAAGRGNLTELKVPPKFLVLF